MRRKLVAMIGASQPTAEEARWAEEVGREIARRGWGLVTGGLGGCMEAASRGAADAGGLVVGILPGADPDEANAHVEIAVATGMGDARNAVIADTAEAFVAIGKGLGTLSEIAFALKRGKRVVGLGTWELPGVVPARDAAEAVRFLAEKS